MDLRFADDILLLANSGPELAQILDKFVKAVGKVGLRLNVDKTVILTNEAQPPNTLVTKDGLILKVLERNQRQKWLGCILTACGSMMQHLDLAYHMEQGILEFWVLLRCLPLLRWVGSLVLIRPSWEVSIRAPEAPALAAGDSC